MSSYKWLDMEYKRIDFREQMAGEKAVLHFNGDVDDFVIRDTFDALEGVGDCKIRSDINAIEITNFGKGREGEEKVLQALESTEYALGEFRQEVDLSRELVGMGARSQEGGISR